MSWFPRSQNRDRGHPGDTVEYLGRKYQGLSLPVSVLKKVYHDNAVKWLPGVVDGSH